jgi:hypothetical protein
LTLATGLNTTALVFATVLGIFSLLEAAFGICVACKIYPFVYRFLYPSNKHLLRNDICFKAASEFGAVLFCLA